MSTRTVVADSLAALPVTQLKGVGPRLAVLLARLDIHTVQDLLFHLPLRYQDRSRLLPFVLLEAGMEALTEGVVVETKVTGDQRRTLKVALSDGTRHNLLLRFFHFSSQQVAMFRTGVRVRCYGEVRQGYHTLEMIHPEYHLQHSALPTATDHAPQLIPIYPSTEGLQQPTWHSLMDQALAWLARLPPAEYLPAEILTPLALPSLVEALHYLHRPPLGTSLSDLTERRHPVFLRLAFEELTAHQVSLRQLRLTQRAQLAPPLRGDGSLCQPLRAALPFQLTAAQERVLTEISADLQQERPMQRLLQGDVGAGKTVVAALAAAQAIEAGYQVALMAPTELLSEQHHRSLGAWLTPQGIAPLWLAGRHKGKERAQLLEAIASGAAQLIVGTHALFQDAVIFHRLGLVIIDEQHRFGVAQRLKLRSKGGSAGGAPHQLMMTATPIPRSLAMTMYADLDLSVIDALPPGRTPIVTVAVSDERRDEVIERVRHACQQGRQAYWVCTLIDESEVLECQAAEETAQQLRAALPEVTVGLVHGRMKGSERDTVMAEFTSGAVSLLVATTVIEVGVDVPNASLMIIENPERLGLSQLHQLRGRVGRGAVVSHCVLLYHAPLSALTYERLSIIRATTDGFEIAERDLALRGAGEVLGTRQAGAIQFRLADPLRDQQFVAPAQQAADLILMRHPEYAAPLLARWLGQHEGYGQV
ncbi:ATP-dependent DNA helicase RecG [Chromatium okenii]|uniref:ATP-dependent DNA helicase RecG n=1 Tax=Chromatium okenii TaxID=61644 RepID=A0A2S7XSW6_9GAMM|nr:ATP-dependent DNA helicase RecG [Chromatium okenii]PQJ96736.1 ATP-dependent DNA helicase RecG [Chromatium okenii]